MKRAAVVQRVGDRAEVPIAQAQARFLELRVVQKVEPFDAQLQRHVPLDGEASRHPDIDVEDAVFAENIPAQITAGLVDGGERERRLRQNLLCFVRVVDLRAEHRRVDQVGTVDTLTIQVAEPARIRARIDREGRPGFQQQHACRLPAANDAVNDAVACAVARRLIGGIEQEGMGLVKAAEALHGAEYVVLDRAQTAARIAADCGVGVVGAEVHRLAPPVRCVDVQPRPGSAPAA